MLTGLIVASLLAVASDPEGVVTTAPTGSQSVPLGAEAPVAPDVPAASTQAITPHGLSTDQQIDQWISQRAGSGKPFADDMASWGPVDDRKMHGEVSAAVGTGDFTAYSATVSIPVGDSSRVDLSYSESKNGLYGGGYGYPGYGYGYPGVGYGLNGYGRGGYGREGTSRSFGIGYSFDSAAGERSRRPNRWDRWRDADDRDQRPVGTE